MWLEGELETTWKPERLIVLVSAYLGCPGERAVKWMCFCCVSFSYGIWLFCAFSCLSSTVCGSVVMAIQIPFLLYESLMSSAPEKCCFLAYRNRPTEKCMALKASFSFIILLGCSVTKRYCIIISYQRGAGFDQPRRPRPPVGCIRPSPDRLSLRDIGSRHRP